MKMKKSWFLIALFVLIIASSLSLDVSYIDIYQGVPSLIRLFGDAIPPDLSIIEIGVLAIFETIQIAFLGTAFGAVIALPMAFAGARNIARRRTVAASRVILAKLRTLPSLLWAVIFVIMVGTGPLAGVLAVTMYTVGYLGKLQYEAIEGISSEPLDAIASTGANKLQLIRFVALPESANNLLSQILFMFEYNVRSSAILGFVGAGGIGFYLSSYLRFMEYDKVLTLLIITFSTLLIFDYLSIIVRDRYLIRRIT